MKEKTRNILSVAVFLFGFLLSAYPLISGLVERQYQKNAVATYRKEAAAVEKTDTEQVLSDARQYNSLLYQTENMVVEEVSGTILGEESYQKQLNVTGTGVMGSIDIPKINVSLPIYHGTGEDVLSSGAGHLEGSSLPVGGKNTRTILTGHRGLPNSKLFTRLDELEEGDLFYLNVLDETLAYRVNDIRVIDPEDTDSLKIEPEKDLATLITCTPYGINTRRLVVTGERVEYVKAEHDAIKGERMSLRELVFALIPFAFLAAAGLRGLFAYRRKRKQEGREKQGDSVPESAKQPETKQNFYLNSQEKRRLKL